MENREKTGRDRERQGDLRVPTIIIVNLISQFFFFYFSFRFFIWKSKIDTREYYNSSLDCVARNQF